MGKPLYDIKFTFSVAEQLGKGVKITRTYKVDVDGFEVIGGGTRFIMADGRGGIGDADLMAEFYQARQFRNLNIVKPLNRESFVMDKIYYLKLSFEFTLVIQSLTPASRFRSLQLNAKNVRFTRPPDRGAMTERLFFKFSESDIVHSYYDYSEAQPIRVREYL
jgi:hypothetical protein